MSESTTRPDVLVVGGGNAGFSAAHAAAERGASVLVVEKAAADAAGGNTFFTAGAFRTAHDGFDDLASLCDPAAELHRGTTDLPPYRVSDFAEDMKRLTDGRCDPVLTDLVTSRSRETVEWLRGRGIRWTLLYARQSFQVDGRYRFWGGLSLGTVDGGKGLIEQHTGAAARAGVEVRYGVAVRELLVGEGGVEGVRATVDGEDVEIRAGSVILSAGGFESNPDMRAEHMGPQWRHAKVRGTPHNTGEVLRAALDIGAQRAGDWASAHAVAWDVTGDDDAGDRELTNLLTKQSYPIGIVVNRDGARFLDEGADFRNYTYAKYGKRILDQPGAISYQLFDAKTRPLVRSDEYTADSVTAYQADTVADLAVAAGIDPEGLVATIQAFNAAVVPGEFNPTIKDGKGTRGIAPPKSNWAQPLDSPPFYAFAVTCGITFTFGGVRVDDVGRVLDDHDRPIDGLYAAGEMVGGLFHGNYPGGSGWGAGSVIGRAAGTDAAERRA
jgi:tricarballylate dehydrogenase